MIVGRDGGNVVLWLCFGLEFGSIYVEWVVS